MELINFNNYEHFEWDFVLHFPIPTLEYVKNRTGIDILSLKNNSEPIAKAELLSLVRTARNYLFRTKNMQQKQLLEYRIAHDINLLNNILEFVMEFIHLAYTSGDLEKMYSVSNSGGLFIPALETAIDVLGIRSDFVAFIYPNFYEGY